MEIYPVRGRQAAYGDAMTVNNTLGATKLAFEVRRFERFGKR